MVVNERASSAVAVEEVSQSGITTDVKCWYYLKKGHIQNDFRLKNVTDREQNERQNGKIAFEKPSDSSSAAMATAAIANAQRFTDITEGEYLDVAMVLEMTVNSKKGQHGS
jgi:hypothetical protein